MFQIGLTVSFVFSMHMCIYIHLISAGCILKRYGLHSLEQCFSVLGLRLPGQRCNLCLRCNPFKEGSDTTRDPVVQLVWHFWVSLLQLLHKSKQIFFKIYMHLAASKPERAILMAHMHPQFGCYPL